MDMGKKKERERGKNKMKLFDVLRRGENRKGRKKKKEKKGNPPL